MPTAPRTPNPRSVKLSPLRTVRPTPSYGTHLMNSVSTPPCKMKSSSNRPTSLSASAVQTAVLRPKQRRSPRATLYSPPPSQTLNSRAERTRPSPGSSRSMISPSATRSYLHDPAGLSSTVAMALWLKIQRSLFDAPENERKWGAIQQVSLARPFIFRLHSFRQKLFFPTRRAASRQLHSEHCWGGCAGFRKPESQTPKLLWRRWKSRNLRVSAALQNEVAALTHAAAPDFSRRLRPE